MNRSVDTVNEKEKEQVAEVWAKIFSPKAGDLVEFTKQFNRYGQKSKHYKVRGKVLFVGKNFCTIQVSKEDIECIKRDMRTNYVNDQVRVSIHHKRIRTIVEEEDCH